MFASVRSKLLLSRSDSQISPKCCDVLLTSRKSDRILLLLLSERDESLRRTWRRRGAGKLLSGGKPADPFQRGGGTAAASQGQIQPPAVAESAGF